VPTAVGNRYCVNDGRPHPHHTNGDTSFFGLQINVALTCPRLSDSPPSPYKPTY
jgi:hypothetical protein